MNRKTEMIQFDESFFAGEEREGFYIEEQMKRAWAAQMEVLLEIERICQRCGVRYFADGGTLLGGVRHQGFIPWDDDIDIAMTRDAYIRFFQAAQTELPSGWVLRDWSNGGSAPFARMINTSHICLETEHLKRFHGCPYIVGVDIFPLDCVPVNSEEDDAWHLLLRFMSSLLGKLEESGEGCITEEAESAIRSVEAWCHTKLERNGRLSIQIRELMLRLVQCYQGDDAEELEMAVWDWSKDSRYKYKREWYADSVRVPFENITIPIPCGYDGVLRVWYGDDYMTPKRGTAGHEYPFYREQEEYLRKQNT